jgi:hypothetical protein
VCFDSAASGRRTALRFGHAASERTRPRDRDAALFRRAPLLVPQDVAVAVETNSGRVLRLCVNLHHELGLHDELFARVTLLPVPWTAECCRRNVTRQTPVLELLPDDETDAVWIYRRLAACGCGNRGRICPDLIRKNRNR